MKYKIATNTWLEIWRYINIESECVASIIISKERDSVQNYDCVITIKDGTSTGLALKSDNVDFVSTAEISISTEQGLKNLPTDENKIPEYLVDLGLLPEFIK